MNRFGLPFAPGVPMRLGSCVALASVCVLVATPVLAQRTNEDGIRAMVRGDYKAAARILKPLADDVAHPDPVAQFFLAVLYETGQGVAGDMARACGLFARSALRDHPFSEQSAAIAGLMRDQLGAGASMLCVATETWRGGAPQTIRLGPEHQITFTDTSVVVSHGDQETRTSWQLPPEAIILPIQYTSLSVTHPVSTQRHFLQFFQWLPDESRNPGSWTLTWALSEVVGDQWLLITYEASAAVVMGPSPPPFRDIANLIRVGVNANGEAEFTIMKGATKRTELIPLKERQ